MGSFGGYFKGEKKKKKQNIGKASYDFTPVFVPPKVIGKRKIKD